MFRLRISIQWPEAEIEPKGRQSEQAGKRVLLLGDPRDRFDLDRMQGEKHRGEPASRNTDPAENQPDQHGIAGVQQYIDDVVPDGVQTPESVFEIEQGEGQWVVLAVRPHIEPDPRKPPGLFESEVFRDVDVVIPDEAVTHGRHVGGERAAHDHQ